MYIYIYTHTHTYMTHIHSQTHTHTCIHTCIKSTSHACIHAYTKMHTYTHTTHPPCTHNTHITANRSMDTYRRMGGARLCSLCSKHCRGACYTCLLCYQRDYCSTCYSECAFTGRSCHPTSSMLRANTALVGDASHVKGHASSMDAFGFSLLGE